MSSWADIKNLAAQLKHVQASESTHCLSDRICVDIVSYLINSGRLQLVRTIDGRTLLTSKELFKEIIEEIEAHRGRISVLEIAKNLDIEYSIIESCINELASKSSEFLNEQCTLVAGELMTKSYIKRVAEEIRDRLEFRGVMSSIELTRIYNVTPQFLKSIINEYNNVLFKIQREGDKFYTKLFLDKQKAKVSGYLSAVLAPMSLADCSSILDIPQKVLTSLTESLISSGRLKGSLMAGKSIFMPSCFRRAQDTYIADFLRRNGYIEWSVVQRLGIPDPASYLRSQFPSAIHTKEFTICESTLSQLKSVLADKSESQWIDVSHYLPQVFGSQEREWLIKPLLAGGEFVEVDGYLYLYPERSLLDYLPCFDEFIREKAVVAACEKLQKSADKSSSGIATSTGGTTFKGVDKKGKSGRAREIKKNVKKKYLRKSSVSEEEEDEEQIADFYLPREDLLNILVSHIGLDAPVDLVEGILDKLVPKIYESFLSKVKSVCIQNSDSSKHRDEYLAEKDALTSTLHSIQLLERGCLTVNDENLRGQLLRQLIRSEVSTFVNRLYLLLAQSYDIQWPNSSSEPQKSKNGKQYEQTKQEESQAKGSLLPCEITPQERDFLVSQLNKVGEGMEKKAAALIQEINVCLRSNTSVSTSGKGLPLDNVLDLCDDLASVHLGLNLSISLLRGSSKSTAKRKKQDRVLALEIAAKTEHQLKMASSGNGDEPKYLASVTLAGAAFFGHCIAGWPLPVHGKLVPQLSAWISRSLSAKTSGSSASYPSAMDEMRTSKAGDQLARLTSLVMEEARQKTDQKAASTLSAEEKKELVAHFVATVSRCRKAMQGNSPPTATAAAD